MSWWAIGMPSTTFSERTPSEQQEIRTTYGLVTADTPEIALSRAAADDAAATAAKQRWWFLLAGLAVGAGVMHWRMKRKRGRG